MPEKRTVAVFEDHPQRHALNDEAHARPPEPLSPPLHLTYLAFLSPWSERERERALVSDLANRFGAAPPAEGATHYSADLGAFRLKWERHGEFSRYKFIASRGDDIGPAGAAPATVPVDWLAALPGQRLVATNIVLEPGSDTDADVEALAKAHFDGNVLIGSNIGDGAGSAFTDFRIHSDGYGRLLVRNRSMTPRQAGRMVQRLLEIDTYRMLALLALPVARELAPQVTAWEGELAGIAERLVGTAESEEPVLLERLTRLAAEIDSRDAAHDFRFRAATAYYALVQRRIDELREERIPGLQTFKEFTERRLAPAMNTCLAVASRQSSLSQRVARTTQLLSTRVDLTRERQNQALLESMDRRAQLQLRLQQTVEGLSAAAITYYVVGLVASAAKGLKAAGTRVDPDVAAALSIPIVAVIVYLGLRRLRRMVIDRSHN